MYCYMRQTLVFVKLYHERSLFLPSVRFFTYTCCLRLAGGSILRDAKAEVHGVIKY